MNQTWQKEDMIQVKLLIHLTLKGDDDDNDTTHLIPHEEGDKIGMKRRFPPDFSRPPGTSTSQKGQHETSFMPDTPSGNIFGNRLEQERYEADKRIEEVFPNADGRKFFARVEKGRVEIKIVSQNKGLGLRNVWHPILDEYGNVIINEAKFPKTLRDALGKTALEIATEKIAENTEANDKDEEEITELRKQRENATISEQGEIDRRVEEVKARIEGRNQENAAIEERLTLRQRIKAIFKKYGFTSIAIATAISTVIGVIVSNLKAGLTKVAKGVGNGLKELGKKLGEILPGMIGAIASFIFRTAGEVIGFLAKNAWLLIVGLAVLAVEQLKKKSK